MRWWAVVPLVVLAASAGARERTRPARGVFLVANERIDIDDVSGACGMGTIDLSGWAQLAGRKLGSLVSRAVSIRWAAAFSVPAMASAACRST